MFSFFFGDIFFIVVVLASVVWGEVVLEGVGVVQGAVVVGGVVVVGSVVVVVGATSPLDCVGFPDGGG